MAKTIVFFNLADMHTHGLAKTSVQALQRKYQRYSFGNYIRKWRELLVFEDTSERSR